MNKYNSIKISCTDEEAKMVVEVINDYKKQIKDLETANARLFKRNHELQVDNEESLKEVEKQYKIVAALRNENMNALSSIKDVSGYVEELQQENLEYSKRCEELRKANVMLVEDFARDRKIIEELRNTNANLYSTNVILTSPKQTTKAAPKSKFVITVEEF